MSGVRPRAVVWLCQATNPEVLYLVGFPSRASRASRNFLVGRQTPAGPAGRRRLCRTSRQLAVVLWWWRRHNSAAMISRTVLLLGILVSTVTGAFVPTTNVFGKTSLRVSKNCPSASIDQRAEGVFVLAPQCIATCHLILILLLSSCLFFEYKCMLSIDVPRDRLIVLCHSRNTMMDISDGSR